MIGLSFVNSASNSRSRQAVRMLARRLQPHEIDDVDDAHLQLRQVLAQQLDGGERLERRHVAAARHDDVGLARLRRCSPTPRCRCRRCSA